MDLNYNKRYAYAEVYSILNWLGDDYKKKVPKNLLQLFKLERKFGYEPEIDFTKPLNDQIRQETKNLLAYLVYTCWLENENDKKAFKEQVDENARRIKEQRKLARQQERAKKGIPQGGVPLNAAIDDAFNALNGKK